MRIEKFDGTPLDSIDESLIKDIFEKRLIGCVIRGFLDPSEMEVIHQGMNDYPYERFEVFPGYNATPRPFDYTLNTNQEDYMKEVDFIEGDSKLKEAQSFFREKIGKISNDAPLTFASRNNDFSCSKAWSSYRELQPNKGLFELHCGNVFRLWNKEFFSHQYKSFESMHLSCVCMIQKPETKVDIVIYKPHFEEFPEKVNHDTLKDVNGNEISLSDIPKYDVELHAGDLLLFDESNYWHVVPEFSGKTSRITFGGFLSKFKEENEYMLWA